MSAALLVIHGGDPAARAVFEREGRALWAAALPVVLEKHGYVDVEVAGPEALRDPARLEGRAGVLVGRQPAESWSGGTVERLLAAGSPAFLEAPLPAPVLSVLGVEQERHLPPVGQLRMPAPSRAGTCRIAERRTSRVVADPSLHWAVLAPDLIGEAQARAWRRTGWDAYGWKVEDGTDVLAEWRAPDGSDWPGLVRRGTVTAACFGLLTYLGQAHTADPAEPGELRATPDTLAAERALLDVIDGMHAEARVPRVRLLPWQRRHAWALNIRHDFDRALSPRAVVQALRRHRAAGTAATWYWRARHLRHPAIPLRHAMERSVVHTALDHPEPGTGSLPRRVPSRLASPNRALRLVARDPRHEVALHTELPWIDDGTERRLVERVGRSPVAGSSSHGDVACFRFQGAANLLWAEAGGLAYTEQLQAAHRHPYRPALLGDDGVVRPGTLICLPKHASLDVGLSKKETYAERVLAEHERWTSTGGLLQLMNHPDINQDALFDLVGDLPSDGRLSVTAGQAVDWWARTHVIGCVSVVGTADGEPRLDGPPDLQAEVLFPTGRRSVIETTSEPAYATSPRQAAIA